MLRPQLSPLLSTIRNVSALIAVFSIVLAWHGSRLHYICWVSLSALELIIEWLGNYISKTAIFETTQKSIGDINTRRLVAFSMLTTVIPGIFGVFFFLGQEDIGMTIFKKILLTGLRQIFTLQIEFDSYNAGFVFLHWIILGYFYNQVCIDLEYQIDRKKIKSS
ncbi:hypothetical protein WR25_18229 [Diploscapter pachys]|uniref:Uncharacterized protein n=1 Tax=Diploscapter pachys TaxID=2018661 RepID=A0A2A2LEI9_9BILA|nr:hypothetical protein WR25_18229 [Diploscapter pachys]